MIQGKIMGYGILWAQRFLFYVRVLFVKMVFSLRKFRFCNTDVIIFIRNFILTQIDYFRREIWATKISGLLTKARILPVKVTVTVVSMARKLLV